MELVDIISIFILISGSCFGVFVFISGMMDAFYYYPRGKRSWLSKKTEELLRGSV